MTDSRRERLFGWLGAPRDAAGLAAFRMLFGTLMLLATIRFAAYGWIDEIYAAPSYHFSYFGFEWVKAWSLSGMYVHFFLMGVAALCLALGFKTRLSAATFFSLFTYAELLEKSAYLNHYYLVSLLSLLLVFVPSERAWSLDARGQPSGACIVPGWAYMLLQAQLGIVYLFAGLAKLNSDWLVQAQPLRLWLGAFEDAPLVGPLLGELWVARAMSWFGALYDLLVFPMLCWRRTRAIAFVTAVLFHVSVWLLFPIGVFSWVMLVSTTLCFEPGWPRRALGRWGSGFTAPRPDPNQFADARRTWIGKLGIGSAGLFLTLQLLLPLRHLFYPGWVNWTEEGFRFSWRVMLIEKTGQVEFDVVGGEPERRVRVYPRHELTPLQYQMMSTQPDMIHQYAHFLEERYRDQLGDVRVYARAYASLNGRPSQALIDPKVDLAREPRGLWPKRFILPLQGK